MEYENAWRDATVAAAVAGSTIAVTVLLESVYAVEPNTLLQLSPLSVYFVYLFTHERLPSSVDRPLTWIALAAVAGIAVLALSL
ncbi:MAG: hypothetical protein ACOC0Z_08980 [Halohasta sp.]